MAKDDGVAKAQKSADGMQEKRKKKRPGKPRTSKMKREKKRLQKQRENGDAADASDEDIHPPTTKKKSKSNMENSAGEPVVRTKVITADAAALGEGSKPKRKNKERTADVAESDQRSEPKRNNKKEADAEEGSKPKRTKPTAEDAVDRDTDNEPFRVYVSGLPPLADEKILKKTFKACGKVKSVKIVRDSRLRSRGVAFISFAEEASVEAALELDTCKVDEQVINVKRAEHKSAKAESGAPADSALQVYVSGLPYDADEPTLRKDFEECGKIAKFKMLMETSTGKPRFKGSLFVTYKKQSGVDAALKFDSTEYGGRTLSVRPAVARSTGRELRYNSKSASD